MTPVERARIHVARKTPWRHQARGPDWLDCIGLVLDAFVEYNIRDVHNYSRSPSRGLLERHAYQQFGPPVPRESMRENDMVLIGNPSLIRHVGIIGNHPSVGLSLIHTSGSTRFVTEHRIDKTWDRLIRIVHRMPEL